MSILDRISKGQILICDGAMGTQLSALGVEASGSTSLTAPEKIQEVHENYINSGSNIIISNTFTSNRIYMDTHGITDNIDAINLESIKIARGAASKNSVLVAGDIGPTGQMMEPFGIYTKQQMLENYMEQARLLEKAGADFFIIETMMDLNEAVCALEACKSVSKLPVFSSMTYSSIKNGGRTMMGNSAEDCAKRLTDSGADAIGANCGNLDPFEMSEVVSTYRSHSGLPVIAQPNAGKPKLVDGKTVFDMVPEKFAEGVQLCIKAGASVVGGCCGTSPEYIKAIASLIK